MSRNKKTGTGKGNPRGQQKTQKVRTARGRKSSSTRWLQRQLNDPYVREAQRLGYRSRAAFKLLEINEKSDLIKKGMSVVDLGAAPGGWCQVALEAGAEKVVGIDLLAVDDLAGVTMFEMDFTHDDAPRLLTEAIGGEADVVLSDMAPNTIGHKNTDHLRIMALVELAFDFACRILKQNGSFVAKVFEGGAQQELQAELKRAFKSVKYIKPPASRKDSSEMYLVATGFRLDKSELPPSYEEMME